MKKILAGILFLCLTLNITACGSAPASSGSNSSSPLFEGTAWIDNQVSPKIKEALHCTDSFAAKYPPYEDRDSNYDELAIGYINRGINNGNNWSLKTSILSDNFAFMGFETDVSPVYACLSYSGMRDSVKHIYPDSTNNDDLINFLQKENCLLEGTIVGTSYIEEDGSVSSGRCTSGSFDLSRPFYAVNATETDKVLLNCLPVIIADSTGKEQGYYAYSSNIMCHSCELRIFSLVPATATPSEREAAIRTVISASECTREDLQLNSFYRIGYTGYYMIRYDYTEISSDVCSHPDREVDKNAGSVVLAAQSGIDGIPNLFIENQTYTNELEVGNKEKYTEFLKTYVSKFPVGSNYEQYTDISVGDISTLADNQELIKFKITYSDGSRFIGGLVNITDVKQALTFAYMESPNSDVTDASDYRAIDDLATYIFFDADLKKEV